MRDYFPPILQVFVILTILHRTGTATTPPRINRGKQCLLPERNLSPPKENCGFI